MAKTNFTNNIVYSSLKLNSFYWAFSWIFSKFNCQVPTIHLSVFYSVATYFYCTTHYQSDQLVRTTIVSCHPVQWSGVQTADLSNPYLPHLLTEELWFLALWVFFFWEQGLWPILTYQHINICSCVKVHLQILGYAYIAIQKWSPPSFGGM